MEDRNQTKYDKAMVNRLARATGHLKMVKQMVEDGRDCSEVLIQLAWSRQGSLKAVYGGMCGGGAGVSG